VGVFAFSMTFEGLGVFAVLLTAAWLSACSSMPYVTSPTVATQTEEVQKLQSAEYQDDMSAMSFEDNNQTLGNYYAEKGAQVHNLIDRMEEGRPVTPAEIDQALNNGDSEKYDQRPPVPLDDEIGNGY
jgi:hypothetical protein